MLVLVLVVVAVLNQHRAGQANRALSNLGGAQRRPDPGPEPGQARTRAGARARLVPAVACPQIRDEQSHLGYSCIDNYLQQDGTDTNLGPADRLEP